MAPDYGIYEALLDGKALSAEVSREHEPGANEGGAGAIDEYHSEVYVAEDRPLAWRRLSPGTHVLSFRCAGKNHMSTGYGLGLDTLILARIGELREQSDSRAAELRRWGERGAAWLEQLGKGFADPSQSAREAAAWALTQEPAQVPRSLSVLRTALGDPDPVVRGLAAVALRNCGLCAEPALPELVVRVNDTDPNVRIASADAIAKLGEKAAPAVAALITAGQAPNEHPHGLRSVAGALGAIGPAAVPALPVLEQMQQHIRVRWAAQSAIARIQRRDPPQGP